MFKLSHPLPVASDTTLAFLLSGDKIFQGYPARDLEPATEEVYISYLAKVEELTAHLYADGNDQVERGKKYQCRTNVRE
jgi:hypothetical protein